MTLALASVHNVVELFNNVEVCMSTVNFSVPDNVKDAFNATFEGQNKSAVIADLMREAVERAKQKKASEAAFLRIVKPPDTLIVWPVMKPASSLNRKHTMPG